MSELIEITRFLDKPSAELAKALLEDAGIGALVMADDMGGLRPHMSMATGVRLLVPENRFSEARALLESSGHVDPQEKPGHIDSSTTKPLEDCPNKSVDRAFVCAVFGLLLPVVCHLYSLYILFSISNFKELSPSKRMKYFITLLIDVALIALLTHLILAG